MEYDVWVDIVGVEGYKYIQPLTINLFRSRVEAEQAIELAINPDWSEGRKASFKSHCHIKEVNRAHNLGEHQKEGDA